MKARLNCQVATIKALSPLLGLLAQWGQTNLGVEVDLTRSKSENSIYGYSSLEIVIDIKNI